MVAKVPDEHGGDDTAFLDAAPRRVIEVWPHPACMEIETLLAQCDRRLARTGGPGGQHRNRVDSKVILMHRPTGIESAAGERRSATDNLPVAIRRMRLTLAIQVRTPVPLGEIGSELWRARRRQVRDASGRVSGRISCSPEHHDFPSLLAEALDVMAAAGWDPKRAALRLDVTMSQLVRLIKDYPPALEMVNRERAKHGEHGLK